MRSPIGNKIDLKNKFLIEIKISRFYTYERVQEIVQFIQTIVPTKPEVAIICGSGLGGLAELIINKTVIPYSNIPHFPRSTGRLF